jgi:tRNA-2-methylthio-N6-dimethylallyladenosine synthase
MGCVAQQAGESLLKRFGCIDFVIGTDSLHMLAQTIDDIKAGKRVCELSWQDNKSFSIAPFARAASVSGSLTIMKGCNNFCSYCIVPYVRGREVSRSEAEIISEAQRLIESGARELTLLGQNVNSYQHGETRFPALLSKVAQLNGLKRLRFVTAHPKDFNIDTVKVMAEHPNIAPLVHLPLQAGSDAVLTRMNRHYTLAQYLDKLDSALAMLPKLRFSSDFIVGFPGETESDFEKTLEAIRYARYESLFAFKYSVRAGTKAEQYANDVPEAEKARRLEEIHRLTDELAAEQYADSVGKSMLVLVDGASKRDEAVFTGRTVYGKIVNFTADAGLQPQAGDEVAVTITEVKQNSLFGKVV